MSPPDADPPGPPGAPDPARPLSSRPARPVRRPPVRPGAAVPPPEDLWADDALPDGAEDLSAPLATNGAEEVPAPAALVPTVVESAPPELVVREAPAPAQAAAEPLAEPEQIAVI